MRGKKLDILMPGSSFTDHKSIYYAYIFKYPNVFKSNCKIIYQYFFEKQKYEEGPRFWIYFQVLCTLMTLSCLHNDLTDYLEKNNGGI